MHDLRLFSPRATRSSKGVRLLFDVPCMIISTDWFLHASLIHEALPLVTPGRRLLCLFCLVHRPLSPWQRGFSALRNTRAAKPASILRLCSRFCAAVSRHFDACAVVDVCLQCVVTCAFSHYSIASLGPSPVGVRRSMVQSQKRLLPVRAAPLHYCDAHSVGGSLLQHG